MCVLGQLFYYAWLYERVDLYMRVKVFPSIFKMGRSKQNDIVELLKFSFKMVDLN